MPHHVALCCAVVVNSFSPLRERFFAHTPATAEVWTCAELITRYPQLLEWRDQLYARAR